MTTTEFNQAMASAYSLLTANAVRSRCAQILEAADDLSHFRVNLDRLDAAADFVVETIRENYPTLEIPFHARWRHFVIEREDRWSHLVGQVDDDVRERARVRMDLAVTSVLLDAGAGPKWRYYDAKNGSTLKRSEGLALASLDAFAQGMFSSDASQPLRADAFGLQAIRTTDLADAFQVRTDNPLEGLDGRTALMNALGAALSENASWFPGETPRIGNLFDKISQDHGQFIRASTLLEIVLQAFGPIWPGRLTIDGVNLGDTWRHSHIVTEDETSGLIPFHKLSQWLTYSLIEPLEEAGISVADVDALTGLAEYRNGGLFIDLGVLDVRDSSVLQTAHGPDAELVVEWRALTIALLDRIAPLIRGKLNLTQEQLPLASILEGGTWAAGRRIAATKRSDGSPPLSIISDGSVF